MERGCLPRVPLRGRRAGPQPARRPIRGIAFPGAARRHGGVGSRLARVLGPARAPRARPASGLRGGARGGAPPLAGRGGTMGRVRGGRPRAGGSGTPPRGLGCRRPPSPERGARTRGCAGRARAGRRGPREDGQARPPRAGGARRAACVPDRPRDPGWAGLARPLGARIGSGAPRRRGVGAGGEPRGVVGPARLQLRRNRHRGPPGS